MPARREFDVVVWGATGFTGRLVAEHLADTYGHDGELTWAIGGRNADKLAQIGATLERDGARPEAIVGDSGDVEAMKSLAERTRVVATTVGPYSLYGNELVAACARAGTHYCDLAGEVPWVRRMIDAHEKTAVQSGAILVPSSGFDCIPSDLGAFYLQQQARAIFGTPAQRIHMLVRKADGGISGGTATSMLEIAAEAQKSARCRRVLLDPYSLNPENTSGDDKNESLMFGLDELSGQWVAPFLMASINTRVVRRSAALLSPLYGEDFRYSEFISTGTGAGAAVKAAAISAAMASLFTGAAIPPTRALLRRVLPDPGEGPDENARKRGGFVIDFVGLTEHGDSITAQITGARAPGYGATSRMLGETAVALSKRKKRRGTGGGFLTPASAMGDGLVDRLQADAGMAFSVKAHSPAG